MTNEKERNNQIFYYGMAISAERMKIIMKDIYCKWDSLKAYYYNKRWIDAFESIDDKLKRGLYEYNEVEYNRNILKNKRRAQNEL